MGTKRRFAAEMEHRFVPYVDPDYRKVQRVLKSEIPFKTKTVKQFDVPAYYRANVKDKKVPIYVQHGLQNYAQMQLGDNRLRYDRSFSHEVFRPHIPRPNPDEGLSEEHIVNNRRRDYQYVRQVFQGRTDSVCDEVLEAIKLKLKIRTKIGLYELIETFKHFTEEGKEGITFNQMRMVFEMMGFTFSENQVLALFCRYDTDLTGEISYKEFIKRLMDGDFMEAPPSWLRLKGQPVELPETLRRAKPEDQGDYLENRRHELSQLFNFVDTRGVGQMDRQQLELFLTIIGADLVGDGLQSHVEALLKAGAPEPEGSVGFETVWEWWLGLPR